MEATCPDPGNPETPSASQRATAQRLQSLGAEGAAQQKCERSCREALEYAACTCRGPQQRQEQVQGRAGSLPASMGRSECPGGWGPLVRAWSALGVSDPGSPLVTEPRPPWVWRSGRSGMQTRSSEASSLPWHRRPPSPPRPGRAAGEGQRAEGEARASWQEWGCGGGGCKWSVGLASVQARTTKNAGVSPPCPSAGGAGAAGAAGLCARAAAS